MTSFKCRSCGAETRWVTLKSGKKMLVDLPAIESVDEPGSLLKMWPDGATEIRHFRRGETLDSYCQYYRSHFSSCPEAEDWRKRE